MKTKMHKKILAFVLALSMLITMGISASALCTYRSSSVSYNLIQACMPNTCGAWWAKPENRYDKVTTYHCYNGTTDRVTEGNVAKPGLGCC